jgi:hypothetical protein
MADDDTTDSNKQTPTRPDETTKTIRSLIRLIILPRLRQGQIYYPWRLPHGNACRGGSARHLIHFMKALSAVRTL